ncbi:MAG: Very short patch repair protein [Syntrophus sp. PtaB.Bin001]|nr:MAG: Very short patch repair protein [Syntrophus sp. PtaB.Bin001]
MDNLTPAQRSIQMAKVHSKDTKPEMIVRRLVHHIGYRYRLHRKDLPGKPDLVFGPRKKVIFVHGCFWHGHNCPLGRIPKSRVDFWEAKIKANQNRDEQHLVKLEKAGWRSLIIWECQLKNVFELETRIRNFLE